MRRAAKIDANHPEIVAALRAIGASVQSLASIGQGCPDLLVGYRGANYALEVKDGNKPPSKRQLTPDELRWHRTWAGNVYIVESPEHAIQVLQWASKI